ncbi:MAG: hypothetical protein CM15mP128_3940 [Methanobacteriota archaeon]|nr:MAG: hypothetical protein CM15mP128_3940 [Euryarchaeota archaeon]
MRPGDEAPHRTYERSWEDIESMLTPPKPSSGSGKSGLDRCREAGIVTA